MHTALLIGSAGALALLLLGHLGLTIFVAIRLRRTGAGPPRTVAWSNAYIQGWRDRDLRSVMVLWTLLLAATASVFCGLLGLILA